MNKTALASALLALTGLTLLPPVQAQDLTLGYLGTSLSGTATLSDTGTTAIGTYFYDDSHNGSGTPLSQQTSYSSWHVYGPSTANIRGGSIYSLVPRDHSTANVSGGSMTYFDTYDTSTANVNGGIIGALAAFNTSTINVSGGSMSTFDTSDTGTANVSGGNISDLRNFSTGMANVSGGNISNIHTLAASRANISGGKISNLYTYSTSTVNVRGGSISNIYTYDTSTVNLFGTNFTQMLVPAPSSVFADTQSTFVQYEVKGTLQDGTLVDASYFDYGGRLLFNNPVPEASSIISFGLLLVLGLGGFAIRRRYGKIAV